MSIRLWEEIAKQKEEVEKQRQKILNTFKESKVAKEMGSMKAEKLFRPITKLLVDKDDENLVGPNYDIDDQTRNFKNKLPLGEGDYVEVEPYADLKPFEEADQSASEKVEDYSGFVNWLQKHGYESGEIVPLPEKSKPGPEEITPLPDPVPEDFEEEVLPGEKAIPIQSYSQATRWDVPPKYRKPRDEDSNDLSTLTNFIRNNEGRERAEIKTKKSKFLGYTIEKAHRKINEIYTERAKKILEKGDRTSAIGQKEIGPYEGKTDSEMRAMIDEFEKQQKGTGLNPIPTLMNRLSLGISSIIAGNTSLKLRKEISSIAQLLFKSGILSQEQKNKIMSLK